MKRVAIKKILNSQEPIAIVRYFEWAIFSKNHTNVRYSLLRLNSACKDIDEIDIPYDAVSFVVSKLNRFEQVFRWDDGGVWERMAFREKAKRLVPGRKIDQLTR
ncbi:hypothetical protein [Sinomicrobium weinanense]|uniref:Uncharacterized protein n=1 Tax=Sinomicrobium weinanense TaxID=2842200 RepID=A0A926Q1K5_9FLAO|nr:hypothetical protein [Sinomicrobium weinanense]MBC9794889.1 hypothetical protein [Sinomicrobium weinanense]MBU3125660.1 hypothetical protein [Sinomicrobium weinanense]